MTVGAFAGLIALDFLLPQALKKYGRVARRQGRASDVGRSASKDLATDGSRSLLAKLSSRLMSACLHDILRTQA